MYSENDGRRTYPVRDFLIKLILIIIFVLLLLWLLPTPKVNLKGLTDRIFNANIQTMKDAALPYFTMERLPQKIDESKTLTLQQMIDMKLLLPFTDKNGDSCDTKKSYVTLTKKSDEYVLKVNLKCGKEEDYILVYVGCYAYCESDICEKEVTDKDTGQPSYKRPTTVAKTVISGPSCELQVSGGNMGSNGWYLGDVTVSFKHRSTTTSGARITDFGLTTAAVPTYNGQTSYRVNKDGSTRVYGYVKDSSGKTAVCSIAVKRDTVAPTCSLGILSGVRNAAGEYVTDVKVGLTSSTDASSGVAAFGMGYNSTPAFNSQRQITLSTNGNHTVYGYVKDNAGHIQKCNIPVKIVKSAAVSVPSCTLEVKSGTKGLDDWYKTNVNVGFKSYSSTNGAKILKWGIGKTENYNQASNTTISTDGTHTIKGFVEDSNGYRSVCSIAVKRDATPPNCSLAVQSGTYNNNGYYTSAITLGFRSRFDATSGILTYGLGKNLNYDKANQYIINTDGSHLVFGFVKDRAGNTNLCAIKVEKRTLAYEYQYSKSHAVTYGQWSNWTESEYQLSSKPVFKKTATEEVEDLGARTTQTYKYEVGSPIFATQQKYYRSIQKKYCEGYNYYQTQTTTTTPATTTYAVKASEDNWNYVGLVRLSNPPTDTLSTRYVFVGMDWEACGNCTITPYTTWKKYTRKVGTVTETTGGTVSVTTNGVTVRCSNLVTKTIDLYLTEQTVVGYSQVRTPVTTTKYYYRRRTRPITKEAYTDYKWSFYNDTALLNQGYRLTGNKRTVS